METKDPRAAPSVPFTPSDANDGVLVAQVALEIGKAVIEKRMKRPSIVFCDIEFMLHSFHVVWGVLQAGAIIEGTP